VGAGDAPVPSIKTFHYFGFINPPENGCQDKSAHILVIGESRPEKLAGYLVKQSTQAAGNRNATIIQF